MRPYHTARIYLFGDNTPRDPWRFGQVPEELKDWGVGRFWEVFELLLLLFFRLGGFPTVWKELRQFIEERRRGARVGNCVPLQAAQKAKA